MALSVEIIDFTRPVANSKNLYISGIVTDQLNEAQITSALYDACSPFGLLYEVQVFPGNKSSTFRAASKCKLSDRRNAASYYAFVKFYSYRAAQSAKVALSKSLKIGSQLCKVCNATRSKETDAGQSLYASKCQELVNFYLSFSGWTSSIIRLEQDSDLTYHSSAERNNQKSFAGPHSVEGNKAGDQKSFAGPHSVEGNKAGDQKSFAGPHSVEGNKAGDQKSLAGPHSVEGNNARDQQSLAGPHSVEGNKAGDQQSLAGPRVRFFCVVELCFPRQGLSSRGIGAWEESYCVQEPASKATAMHKARKRSHQRALEHAFSRVLLVVLTHRGKVKVTVETDTTKADPLTAMMMTKAAEDQVLQVTELDEEFCSEGEEEGAMNSSHNVGGAVGASHDMDDINLHILQELGEGT